VAADERTGVLVIRAWLEEGLGERALRARITQVSDVMSSTTVETAASSEEDVLRTVAEWLETFVAAR